MMGLVRRLVTFARSGCLLATVTFILGACALPPGGDSDSDGVGGTGISDGGDGVGGTGIIGTVASVEPLVVNNVALDVQSSTVFLRNGHRADVSSLQVGHTVEIIARTHRGRLLAQSINAFTMLVGPITKVTPDGYEVMGQPIAWAQGATVTDLTVNDWARVSALPARDGRLIASRVEPSATNTRPFVFGPVRQVSSERSLVGTIAIDGAPPNASGKWLSVHGRWNGQRFESGKVSVRAKLDVTQLVLAVDAFGPLTPGRQSLLGYDVFVSSATSNAFNTERVDVGRRIAITSSRRGSGVLRSDRVELIRARPSPTDLRPTPAPVPPSPPQRIERPFTRVEPPARPTRPVAADRPVVIERPITVDRPEVSVKRPIGKVIQ